MPNQKENKELQFHFGGRHSYDAHAERENNIIGHRISEARKKAGLNLNAFSGLLSEYGVEVSGGGISKWELGNSIPNPYQLIAVCHALGISDFLQFFTSEYHPLLNSEGLRKVEIYKDDLIASGKYRPEPRIRHTAKLIEMPISNLRVSAGTGEFLDENSFETIRFPEASVPPRAEFGVRVSGDSMEPVYHDGQIVWVEQCERINSGEIGIFIYDGEGFLKVYTEQQPDEEIADLFTDSYGICHSQIVLISFNEAYSPKVISPNVPFKVVGRVL